MSEFTVLVSDDRHHLAVCGEIDMVTVDQLDAALLDLCGDIDVDCTGVEFIGSDGFHALDRGYAAAVTAGATFVVSGMSTFHRRIATMLSVPYVVPGDRATPSSRKSSGCPS
jgi:anti-anti-sigma regulatory factor